VSDKDVYSNSVLVQPQGYTTVQFHGVSNKCCPAGTANIYNAALTLGQRLAEFAQISALFLSMC